MGMKCYPPQKLWVFFFFNFHLTIQAVIIGLVRCDSIVIEEEKEEDMRIKGQKMEERRKK